MNYVYPNLFIPGAAKSGTTSLHELLNLHPDICMSSVKEPVFWNKEGFKHPDRIDWYANLFSNKNAKVIGESTTSYMYFPEFITNVKANFNFSPKFIFILRNPIDRCYSNYWYLVGRGQEKKSFEDSVKFDMNRTYENYDYVPDYYYHFGRYAKWLKNFYSNFETESIKIITLENLKKNRLSTLNECYSFLGLNTLDAIPSIEANKTGKLKYPKLYHFTRKSASGKYKYTRIAKYFLPSQLINWLKKKMKHSSFLQKNKSFTYPKISKTQRLWLKDIYAEDIKELKKVTGLSFLEWEDFNSTK